MWLYIYFCVSPQSGVVVNNDLDPYGVVNDVHQPAMVEIEHLISQVAVVEWCTHARTLVLTAFDDVLQDRRYCVLHDPA